MIVLVTALLLAASAPPDDGKPQTGDITSVSDPAGPGEPATPSESVADQLDAAELGELRAGDDTSVYIITDQTLNAVNSGNSVIGEIVGSGAITLSENAFSGYNGIGNFVINTGHNNNLQGSISVSIATAPQ